jgi:hypothetical protein
MKVCKTCGDVDIICPNAEICRKYKNRHWHETWDKKKVFYATYDELRFAKKLDILKTRYEINAIQIPYFDSFLGSERIAIPNFYLPDDNTLVEVRNDENYNRKEMHDRFSQYIKNGYDCILVYQLQQVVSIDSLYLVK